jgi:hypothetical protein
MYSYFEKGIKDTKPKKIIDIIELVKFIKDISRKPELVVIRQFKRDGNEDFKELKRKLHNITPNSILRIRNLETDGDFSDNFIQGSGYLYYDVDRVPNILEFKKEFIRKYGHIVSLVCISSGGDGLSILIKITNTINSKEQFSRLWDEIRNTIFKDENIDPSCKGLGQSMFISFDPDVYYNYENELTIKISNPKIIKQVNKCVNQGISERGGSNRLDDTFSIISFDEVIKKIRLRTPVDVKNPILDIKPIKFTLVKFPKIIKNGKKRKTFTRMIHTLVYLNPELEVDYLFNFLNYINTNFTEEAMDFKKLVRLFNFIRTEIINDENYSYSLLKIKYIHFNLHCGLSGEVKREISNKIKAIIQKKGSIDKINQAIQELESKGIRITRKAIAEISKLSLSTISRRSKDEPIDLNEVEENINRTYSRITGVTYYDRYSKMDAQTSPDEYVHPKCPEWVLLYEQQQKRLIPLFRNI